jgi:hypothetical protein
MVRARIPGDIQRVFPGIRVVQDSGTDYRYRAFVERVRVADTLATLAQNISYGNFKNSIAKDDHSRHLAYLRVWNTMFQEQPISKRHRERRPMGGTPDNPTKPQNQGAEAYYLKPQRQAPIGSSLGYDDTEPYWDWDKQRWDNGKRGKGNGK